MTSPLGNNNTGRSITPVPIENGKRYLIPLTDGLFAKIDAEDLEKIGNGSWSANKRSSGKIYAQQAGLTNQRTSYMHRVIMGVTDPKIEVDHVDRKDTLNNTRENLRIADRSQQLANTSLRSDSTTGFKGVSRYKKYPGYYFAAIEFRGVRINLGRFTAADMAAKIRDRAAIELHGEFAVLNFSISEYENLPTLGVMETFRLATRKTISHQGPRPLRQ
jgi:hypothetical protein